MSYRMLSSILGLNPLDASSTPPTQLGQTKMSPDNARGALGSAVVLGDNHSYRGTRMESYPPWPEEEDFHGFSPHQIGHSGIEVELRCGARDSPWIRKMMVSSQTSDS